MALIKKNKIVNNRFTNGTSSSNTNQREMSKSNGKGCFSITLRVKVPPRAIASAQGCLSSLRQTPNYAKERLARKKRTPRFLVPTLDETETIEALLTLSDETMVVYVEHNTSEEADQHPKEATEKKELMGTKEWVIATFGQHPKEATEKKELMGTKEWAMATFGQHHKEATKKKKLMGTKEGVVATFGQHPKEAREKEELMGTKEWAMVTFGQHPKEATEKEELMGTKEWAMVTFGQHPKEAIEKKELMGTKEWIMATFGQQKNTLC